MSSVYQPVVIRALVEAGGRMEAGELAKRLMTDDPAKVASALATLKRWPKITLGRHGIVRYDRNTKSFELCVDLDDTEVQTKVIEACNRAINAWGRGEAAKVPSRFYDVIQRSGGAVKPAASQARFGPSTLTTSFPAHARTAGS